MAEPLTPEEEATLWALAAEHDPAIEITHRRLLATLDTERARVAVLTEALAKSSDIAEWIGTDIEDYEHGGWDPDYTGWRKATSELCEAARAALVATDPSAPEQTDE